MLTETVSVVEPLGGTLPLAGETLNQPELEGVAVKFSVAVPVLLSVTVSLAGFDPPVIALKLKLVGLSPMVARGVAVSEKAMLTLCGLLLA